MTPQSWRLEKWPRLLSQLSGPKSEVKGQQGRLLLELREEPVPGLHPSSRGPRVPPGRSPAADASLQPPPRLHLASPLCLHLPIRCRVPRTQGDLPWRSSTWLCLQDPSPTKAASTGTGQNDRSRGPRPPQTLTLPPEQWGASPLGAYDGPEAWLPPDAGGPEQVAPADFPPCLRDFTLRDLL